MRAPLKRDLQQQQCYWKHAVAEDDAGMLETARGSTAEHEQRRRQHRARHRPSRAPADGCDGDAACQQVGQHNEVECPHRRGRIERAPGNEQRREDQRLRICYARMPAIMVRIPEWPVASAQRHRQEAEEGIELVLGIPGHDSVPDDPAADGGEPDCRDKTDRNGQLAGPPFDVMGSDHSST